MVIFSQYAQDSSNGRALPWTIVEYFAKTHAVKRGEEMLVKFRPIL